MRNPSNVTVGVGELAGRIQLLSDPSKVFIHQALFHIADEYLPVGRELDPLDLYVLLAFFNGLRQEARQSLLGKLFFDDNPEIPVR